MNGYLLLKFVHIFAVVMFLGNIITGVFWMRMADKTKDPTIIAFTMKGIIRSDRWFTIPGVIIITAGGISAALHGRLPMLSTGWIFWSLVLFSVSGIIFGWKLAPLQKKILRLAENDNPDQFDDKMYRNSLENWERWGLMAILAPIAAMIMMVLKIPAQSGL